MSEPSMEVRFELPPSIEAVVGAWAARSGSRAELVADLVAREDQLADGLRLAGQTFGLFPQIVAKVLADMRFGSPVSDEMRSMIYQQFRTLMEQIARAQGGDGPMPQP